MRKRLTHVTQFVVKFFLDFVVVYQFFQMEPPVDSREKAVWDRANKPPTPEPEPEPEAEEAEEPAEEEAEEGEAVAEGDEAAGLPEGYPEEVHSRVFCQAQQLTLV